MKTGRTLDESLTPGGIVCFLRRQDIYTYITNGKNRLIYNPLVTPWTESGNLVTG